ncbi:uncharacterized protein LOC115879351 isoform X2 [Sitophilus oryzae]|uniref:Uncharacterized protein LOC115879351 isoform X2 n=1 Tax=Sitophilus oryzae TaxID=7048 RepID=A0A6J2XLN5_SITOR|nr:uncharacterized protein LOC115879351 isoform X2 [Sitophilus oryzae]
MSNIKMFYFFGEVELILQEQNLHPCHVCGRTFLPNSLKKHEKICEKNAIKRRKPFDSLKQRVSGTDLADFHQTIYLKKREEPVIEKKPRQSKWKEKHLELVTAIRAAKGMPEDIPKSPSPKPRSTTSLLTSTTSNERCPSCERHFGPKAFDRHVEWCKERRARIQQSPASVQQAKERLEARIKYRVPPLNKSKRTTVRDKYSPNSPQPDSSPKVANSTSNLISSLSRGPSIRKPKSLHNVEKYIHEPRTRPNKIELDKCGGDRKSNKTEPERKTTSPGIPVIGSPSSKSDSVKSISNKRNLIPRKKLNTVNVNLQVCSMVVSSINCLNANKRMVTWKDTVSPGSKTTSIDGDRNFECIDDRQMYLGENNIFKALESDLEEKTQIVPKIKKRLMPKKVPLDEAVSKSQTSTDKNSTESVEKIVSSNDVLHRNKKSKIPTTKLFRTISDLLKKYKKTERVEQKALQQNVITDSEETKIIQNVATHDNTYSIEDTDLDDVTADITSAFEHIERKNNIKNDEVSTVHRSCSENYVVNKVDDEFNDFRHDKISKSEDPDRYHNLNIVDIAGVNDSYKNMDDWFEKEFNTNDNDLGDANMTAIGNDNTNRVRSVDDEFREDEMISDCKDHGQCLNNTVADVEEEVISSNKDKDDSLKREFNTNNNLDIINLVEADATENRNSNISCILSKPKVKSSQKGDEEIPIKNNLIDENDEDPFVAANSDHYNNVVCLFQSSTKLDLTGNDSLNDLTDKKSWRSSSTIDFEKEPSQQIFQNTSSHHLFYTRSSNFSLKKSLSDIDVLKDKDSLKNHVVSIFKNKYKLCESESTDLRKTFQDIRSICSVPAMHVSKYSCKDQIQECIGKEVQGCTEKNDGNHVNWDNIKSKERLEILRIAAEKFIEDSKKNITSSGEPYNIDHLRDEDYAVPKKKRRIYQDDGDYITFNNFVQSSDEIPIPEKNEKGPVEDVNSIFLPKNEERLSTASSVVSDVTPRTFALVKKVIIGRKLKSDAEDILLAVTLSECEKLLATDRRCFVKIENRLNDIEKKDFQLPKLITRAKEDKVNRGVQVEADEVLELPKIYSKMRVVKTAVGENDCNGSNYDPFEMAQRQFMELLECDDFKPSTPSTPSDAPANTPRPHTTPHNTRSSPSPVKKTVKSAEPVKKSTRESVIDPPFNFKDSLDSVNDDFELIENMINEHFGNATNENDTGGGFYLHNLKNNADSTTLMLDQILDNRKYSDDMSSSIDPSLINENDNLSIPDNLKIEDYSPTSTVDTDVTLQDNNVDVYSAKYDKKIEALEPKVQKKPLVKRSLSLVNRTKREASLINPKPVHSSSNKSNKISSVSGKALLSKTSKNISSSPVKPEKKEKTKGLPLLKRSLTVYEPSPKPSFKNKKEVNDYFNGNDQKVMSTSLTSSMISTMTYNIIEKPKSPANDTLKAEELFSVDDEMYEEYKKYEEMYLKEKEQKASSKKATKKKNIDINYGLLVASEEEDHSNVSTNKISSDSAYGSLRKTSKQRSRAPKLSPLEPKMAETLSSSGSENGSQSPATLSSKVSKFCHECGTKFPVYTAKFCVECGVKRLVL